MNRFRLGPAAPVALAALGSLSATSFADTSFAIGAVSDYRCRDISQSRLDPAVNAGVDCSGLVPGIAVVGLKYTF